MNDPELTKIIGNTITKSQIRPFNLKYGKYNGKSWVDVRKLPSADKTYMTGRRIRQSINPTYKISTAKSDFIDVDQVIEVVNMEDNQVGIDIGEFIYMANFSPNHTVPTSKSDEVNDKGNFWFSPDIEQAAGYITNKMYNHRDDIIDGTMSGGIFIHKFSVNKKLDMLNLNNDELRFMFEIIGASEHVLTYHMEVLGSFVCRRVNTILKKNGDDLFDGVSFSQNGKSLILCNQSGIKYTGDTFVYTNRGRYLPVVAPSASINELNVYYGNYYSPSDVTIDSNGSRYRNRIEDLLQNAIMGRGPISAENISLNLISVLIASITNAMRPYIYQAIGELNVSMSKWGQFVVAGGDAINMLLKPEQRKVSPDIDTKFILQFDKFFEKFNNTSSDLKLESEYFLELIASKQHLWSTALQDILNRWNDKDYVKFYNNILKPLETTTPFDLLGVTFIHPRLRSKHKPFRKRLTLMPKSHKKGSPSYDVDLFALDMYLGSAYFVEWAVDDKGENVWIPRMERVDYTDNVNITGILDMPFTRPSHIGYELGHPKHKSMIVIDPFAKPRNTSDFFDQETSLNVIQSIKKDVDEYRLPPIRQMKVVVANRAYAKHDVEILAKLKFREGTKLEKDLYRLKLLYDLDENNTQRYKEEQKAATSDIETRQVTSFTGDIAPLKIGTILRYIAIPKVNMEGVGPDFGFIDCPVANGRRNTVSDIPLELRWDTNNILDYETGEWKECCDVIPNKYMFRFDSKALSTWGRSKTAYVNMECILNSLLQYLKGLKRKGLKDKLAGVGAMCYGFRPEFLENKDYQSNSVLKMLVDNVLIFAIGFQDVGGEMGKLTAKVYRAIVDLRN
jgi:hypothetical protein